MRLIDADALKEALRNLTRWVVKNGEKHNEGFTYDQVFFCIDARPTVDVPDRKVGEWTERKVIEDGKAIEEWQSARCSVCGRYHTTPYMYYFDDFAYCPSCGAEMKGEGDDRSMPV